MSKIKDQYNLINKIIQDYTKAFSKSSNIEHYQVVKEFRNVKTCIDGLVNIIFDKGNDDSFFSLKVLNAKAFLMGQIALKQLEDSPVDKLINLLSFINRVEKRAKNEIKSKVYNRKQ
jgi:hypothetical protein